MRNRQQAVRKAAILIASLDTQTAEGLLDQMPAEQADAVRRRLTPWAMSRLANSRPRLKSSSALVLLFRKRRPRYRIGWKGDRRVAAERDAATRRGNRRDRFAARCPAFVSRPVVSAGRKPIAGRTSQARTEHSLPLSCRHFQRRTGSLFGA